MVKIVVMDWKSFSRKVKSEITEGIRKRSFRKENGVIYAESIDAARSIMTSERMRLLATVKKSHPASLYQLAKDMKKDIKTVFTDANLLSGFGLLSLEKNNGGGKARIRPRLISSKITFEIAI